MRFLLVFFVFLISNISFSQPSWTAVEYPNKENVLKSIEASHQKQLSKYPNRMPLKLAYEWKLNSLKFKY
jgi:hypothetical protein